MDEDVDDRARATLRRVSRALTGKSPYRLEIGLAVAQLPSDTFTVAEVGALLPEGDLSKSHNVSRNLKAFVDASLLEQAEPGGPYVRNSDPFWDFVLATWEKARRDAERVVRSSR